MSNHDVDPRADVAGQAFPPPAPASGFLELEDGTRFEGTFFGNAAPAEGEVVFNTGMVGYVESLTDPSYRGQVLALTYPLVGNYGVPPRGTHGPRFESDRVQVRALVVAHYQEACGHWEAERSLAQWLAAEGITGLTGVDTRELTKILRSRGTMLGRIGPLEGEPSAFRAADPNATDLVAEVTCSEVITHPPRQGAGAPHIVVVDCGCKRSIVNELLLRGCRVTQVPYDFDLGSLAWDGLLLSNGPGNPQMCHPTIDQVARLLRQESRRPIAGICLGCQILALAAGADTYKLPYGHRGQNQPVMQQGTETCHITSQNHGYAVDAGTLPPSWEVWFRNLNDGTVEGIRHVSRPLFAVQFHPEAAPGPTDTRDFFDRLVEAASDV